MLVDDIKNHTHNTILCLLYSDTKSKKEARREHAKHEDLDSDQPDLQAFDQHTATSDDEDDDENNEHDMINEGNDVENAQDAGQDENGGVKDTSEAQTTSVKDRRKEMSKANKMAKLGKKRDP
ncbi:hypothetical protein MRB53_037274 [Persea americana]|nr:hypothetical protein MRB53_037274 [Persea americana]